MSTTVDAASIVAPPTPPTLLDRLLRDAGRLGDDIMVGPDPAAYIAPLAAIATVGAAAFGVAVGLHGGVIQAGLSAIKFAIVLLASAGTSLPLLHVACALSGRPIAPDRLAALILHAVASSAVVMAGLAPVAVVTWLTYSAGVDGEWIAYRRLVLATVAVAGVGGLVGASRLLRHLPITATPPWILFLGLTGLQLSWLLRPIIGMPVGLVILRAPESTGLGEVIHTIGAVLGLA